MAINYCVAFGGSCAFWGLKCLLAAHIFNNAYKLMLNAKYTLALIGHGP
jgi:hypothetical protein